MKKTLLGLFLLFSLFPMSTSFSQLTDKEPTLGIMLTSSAPFNYKDEDGTTVILGEVQNTKSFPVSKIKIWAGFYDDVGKNPLESTIGTTILEVIPPFGKSPYMIKSPSANSAITSVSVNLLGFNSSPEKKSELSLSTGTLNIGERLSLSGKITNNGQLNSTNTKIHLISYDSFVPPRVLGIATIEVSNIIAGGTHDFKFDEKYDSRATKFQIVAESADYTSGIKDVSSTSMDILSKLITISDIGITDFKGDKLSSASVGSSVNVESRLDIQFSSQQEKKTQPYVYWVQIKQSGDKAFVEYIGKAEGTFTSAGQQFPSVEWAPQNKGLYFIETFVWDPNSLPLASKGPISLVLVK